MKNAMKRIMSLALAVMLLISVVPAAFAAEGTVNVNFKDEEENLIYSTDHTLSNGESTSVNNLIAYVLNRAGKGQYEYANKAVITNRENGNVDVSSETSDTNKIKAGDKVWIVVKAKEEPDPIKLVVKADDSDNEIFSTEYTPADGKSSTVENLLHYVWNTEWEKTYTYGHAYSRNQKANLDRGNSVSSGDTLFIMLNSIDKEEDKNDDKNDDKEEDGSVVRTDGYEDKYGNWHHAYEETKNKDPYPVLLKVYLKNSGNAFTYSDTFNITTKAGEDDVLTFDEVYNYLLNHYKSTKSTGIEMDGIYLYEGNFNSAWAEDVKYPKIYNLDKARYSEDDITLAVVLENAKLKSNNADPSNPKTGDDIMIAATTMTLAGAALVAAYELKKRKMI